MKQLLAFTGLTGIGSTIGGVLGGLLGAVIAGVYSFFYVIPYFTAQSQNAPEWYWVMVVVGLIPSAIVVLIGLVIGVVLGAIGLGLLAMLLTAVVVVVRGAQK
jgi:hypothetical protein